MQPKLSRVLFVMAVLLLGVAFSLAQTTTLTPEERESALKSLQATHDAFLHSISGLSEKQWKFKPAPDRWSVAEVSEHIALSESMIFGFVQGKIMAGPATPEKRAEVKVTDEIILQKVP